MKTLIILTLAVTVFCAAAHANTSIPSPFRHSKTLVANAKAVDSLNTVLEVADKAEAASKKKIRICSCQVLQVRSGNEKDSYLVVLAQKTHTGEMAADVNKASSTLEREKKHLKSFFYTDIKVVSKDVEIMDCHQVYAKIKTQYDNVHLYDILDADIMNAAYQNR